MTFSEPTSQTTRSLRSACLAAGLALAATSALAAFGVFGAIAPLVVSGDAVATANGIRASEGLFRWGIAALVVVVVLDVVVAAALLTLFTPVGRGLATLAALFRVAYAAVYLVAILQLVLALDLLDEPEQAMHAIDAYAAKVFGVLLVVAGLGYVVDGFAAVLVPGPSVSVGQLTFVGEVALIVWLLVVGRRSQFARTAPRHADLATPAPETRTLDALARRTP